MFDRVSRPTLIAAVCTAAGLVLATVAAPSHAARFGGGRSVGMSRSLPSSTHNTPHTTPHVDSHAEAPAPSYRTPLITHTPEPLHYAAPASSSYQATRDATMAAALLRSRTLAAQRRQRAQESGMAAGYGSAPAVPYDPVDYRPLPPVATPRVSDPRFTRFTPVDKPTTACEFKPVMTDADYRACGATPPSY